MFIYFKLLKIFSRVMRFFRKDSLLYLIFPPASPGSLGDEAMMTCLVEGISGQGTMIDVLVYKTSDKWACLSENSRNLYIRKLWSKKNRLALLLFSFAVVKYDRFFVLGADVLDGKYNEHQSLLKIKLLGLAFKAGVDVVIVGFSFNDSPLPTCSAALAALPEGIQLKSRDAVSQKRLKRFTGRDVKLTADIAFLLKSETKSKNVLDIAQWISQEKNRGRIIVGLNLNQHVFNIKDRQDLDEIIKKFSEVSAKLIQSRNVSIVGIPHDYRGDDNDKHLLERVQERLPIELKNHFKLLEGDFNSREIKGVCSYLDIVFSCRMHLAIAALGTLVPVGCMVYQGKFEGLFQHFGLENCTISQNEAFADDNLINFIFSIINQKNKNKKIIVEKLPKVKMLSSRNFN